MTRLVFWQNMLAFHQSAHIRALAARGEYEVTWVAGEALSAERKALGWSVPDAGCATVVVAPDETQMLSLIHERPEASIHIFSGLHDAPMTRRAFEHCLPTRTTLGLLSESYDHRGWKSVVRSLRSRLDAVRLGARIDFLLPMGQLGVQWFSRAGFPREKIFPYGYFTEAPVIDATDDDAVSDGGPVQLMYVGQYIQRKGVDVLLQALAGQESSDWHLQLVGEGDWRALLEGMSNRLGLSERVSFLASQPNAEVMRLMQHSDLLILPSRFDGWGAVVNEALLRGTPVVCTDKCGAADLLREDWRGEAVPCTSVPALSEALRRRIAQGRLTPEGRARIREWARCITGEMAADYLHQIIQYVIGNAPRPTPPWYATTNEAVRSQ